MDLYDLEVDTLFTRIYLDSDVSFLMSVFSDVTKGNRAIDNKSVMMIIFVQKKLKFLQLHLIH